MRETSGRKGAFRAKKGAGEGILYKKIEKRVRTLDIGGGGKWYNITWAELRFPRFSVQEQAFSRRQRAICAGQAAYELHSE